MIANDQNMPSKDSAQKTGVDESRRAALRRVGRFAAATPPAVTLLLSAGTKSAKAFPASSVPSSRQFKEPVSIPQLQETA